MLSGVREVLSGGESVDNRKTKKKKARMVVIRGCISLFSWHSTAVIGFTGF